jgi:hypothetical protein
MVRLSSYGAYVLALVALSATTGLRMLVSCKECNPQPCPPGTGWSDSTCNCESVESPPLCRGNLHGTACAPEGSSVCGDQRSCTGASNFAYCSSDAGAGN